MGEARLFRWELFFVNFFFFVRMYSMSGFYEPSAPSNSLVFPLRPAVGKLRTNMSSTSELEIKLITGGGRRASVDLSCEDCGTVYE